MENFVGRFKLDIYLIKKSILISSSSTLVAGSSLARWLVKAGFLKNVVRIDSFFYLKTNSTPQPPYPSHFSIRLVSRFQKQTLKNLALNRTDHGAGYIQSMIVCDPLRGSCLHRTNHGAGYIQSMIVCDPLRGSCNARY